MLLEVDHHKKNTISKDLGHEQPKKDKILQPKENLIRLEVWGQREGPPEGFPAAYLGAWRAIRDDRRRGDGGEGRRKGMEKRGIAYLGHGDGQEGEILDGRGVGRRRSEGGERAEGDLSGFRLLEREDGPEHPVRWLQ